MRSRKRESIIPRRPERHAATLPELLVVLGVVGVLAALLLPAVQQIREKSRQVGCRNNLRQLALAAQAHVSTRGTFPYTSVVSGDVVNGRRVNIYESISPHRHLLAYLEPAIYRQVDFRDRSVPYPYTSGPPFSSSEANAMLMNLPIPVFVCPSDPGPPNGNSYRANMGKGPGIYHPEVNTLGIVPMDPGNRTGAFVNGHALRPQNFKDGLSNTVLFGEKTTGDGNPAVYTAHRDRFESPVDIYLAEDAIRYCRDYASRAPERHASFGGWTWLYGGWHDTWYNHVVTPNSPIPDCDNGPVLGGGKGLHTARSFHPGGVHVAFADGAVKFISDSIDLLVWHAVSTRAGGEAADLE